MITSEDEDTKFSRSEVNSVKNVALDKDGGRYMFIRMKGAVVMDEGRTLKDGGTVNETL